MPLLHDSHFVKKVHNFDVSDEFSELFQIYFIMSVEIDNTVIFESIIPILCGTITHFSKKDNYLMFELKEEIVHKIRKDIALSIDIIIPRNFALQIEGESLEFVGSDIPWGRIATGGLWIASMSGFRTLTNEEKKEYKNVTGQDKNIEIKLNVSWKFVWALKLLGVETESAWLSHSTLWWYFRENI